MSETTKNFKATDSKGRTHTRTSESRTYSHVVVIVIEAHSKKCFYCTTHKLAAGESCYACDGSGLYPRVTLVSSEWASRLDLAQKNAAKQSAKGRTVEILEAVEITSAEYRAARKAEKAARS